MLSSRQYGSSPTGAVTWGDDLDMCSDALYMELTGKTVEEVWGLAAAGT